MKHILLHISASWPTRVRFLHSWAGCFNSNSAKNVRKERGEMAKEGGDAGRGKRGVGERRWQDGNRTCKNAMLERAVNCPMCVCVGMSVC